MISNESEQNKSENQDDCLSLSHYCYEEWKKKKGEPSTVCIYLKLKVASQ